MNITHANQFHTQWTDERVAELKRFLTDGLSAGAISKKMGITRNAIIGKVRRIGSSLGSLNGFHERNPERRPKRPRLVIYRTYAAFAPESSMSVKFDVPVQVQKATTGQPCDILDLTAHTCHWPLWNEYTAKEKLYCGAPSNGKVYCQEHTFMAGPLYRRPIGNQPGSSPPSAPQQNQSQSSCDPQEKLLSCQQGHAASASQPGPAAPLHSNAG